MTTDIQAKFLEALDDDFIKRLTQRTPILDRKSSKKKFHEDMNSEASGEYNCKNGPKKEKKLGVIKIDETGKFIVTYNKTLPALPQTKSSNISTNNAKSSIVKSSNAAEQQQNKNISNVPVANSIKKATVNLKPPQDSNVTSGTGNSPGTSPRKPGIFIPNPTLSPKHLDASSSPVSGKKSFTSLEETQQVVTPLTTSSHVRDGVVIGDKSLGNPVLLGKLQLTSKDSLVSVKEQVKKAVENEQKQKAEQDLKGHSKKKLLISEPKNVEHMVHVKVDPNSATGLHGLPPAWEKMLLASGLTKENITTNIHDTLGVLKFITEGLGAMKSKAKIQQQQPQMFQSKPPPPRKLTLDDLLTEKNPHDEYTDMKYIDQGCFGKVYKARQRKNKQLCAIKAIELNSNVKLEEVLAEISMMRDLSHQNITKFLGTYKYKNEIWIVMEFMDGGKLTDLIYETTFSEEEIASICYECLLALDYLHQNGRIHRDIKSDNVLISSNADIKLADFGFCCSDAIKHRSVVGTPVCIFSEFLLGFLFFF